MISASLILDNSFSMYLVIDEDGYIVSQNKTFKEAYDHIKPESINDIIKDSSQLESYREAVKKAKRIYPDAYHCSFQIRQKNGVGRWTYWSVFAYEGRTAIHGDHVYDINSIQQFEYEKIKSRLQELVWLYNHPARQHAANILALILLTKESDNIEPEIFKNLEMINHSAKELDKIVKKINDFSFEH